VAGPGDGSALVVAMAQTAVPRTYLYRVDGTGVSTLSSFFIFPMLAADLELDDAGDLLLLTKFSGVLNGIYGSPLRLSTTLSLVTPWPSTASEPIAFAEKTDTGDWWTLDQAGTVRLLDRSKGTVLNIVKTGGLATSLGRGDLVEDPVTGDVLIARGYDLLRFDPFASKLTTVVNLGVPQGGAEAMGLHLDQRTRGFLFSNWMGFGPGMYGFVHEVDAKVTTFTRSTALGSPRRPENVAAAWGRAFTAASPPAIGTRYPVQLLSRSDAGEAYRVALALSPRPGIPTPLGTIPLTPDPMFFLSLSGAPLFVNFAGTLNLQGSAVVGVDIPNVKALSGVRLIMAAVVYDRAGLLRILGPHGFTIR